MALQLQVQTHSIENVRKQITNKVSYLIQITSQPVQTNFPTLSGSAQSVKLAVQNLTRVAESIELGDEHHIKQAIQETLVSAQMLVRAVEEIKKTSLPVDCQKLHKSTQQILNGTMKILLIWDESEIRKISNAAQCAQDRLKLVKASRSMRALLVCYNGFFELMMLLIQLTLQRQQDLMDESRRSEIRNCLTIIQLCLPPFSQAMQEFVKNPDKKDMEDRKNTIASQISAAIDGIVAALRVTNTQTAAGVPIPRTCFEPTHIPFVQMGPSNAVPNVQMPGTKVKLVPDSSHVSVAEMMQHVPVHSMKPTQTLGVSAGNIIKQQAAGESSATEDDDIYNISSTTDTESDTIATQLKKIEVQLSAKQRHQIPPELDKYLKAVISNSKSVAEKSKPHFQETILQLCDEIMSIRQDLDIHYEAYKNNPDSDETKSTFDDTIDQLCIKLRELGKVVDNSVADLVAETFVCPSAPLDVLVNELSSQPDNDSLSDESIDGLQKTVEIFRRHSLKLSEVAKHAAQGTLSRQRSKRIKKLSNQLDDLTQKIVSSALEVRKDPQNKETRAHLNELRKEWAEQVKELTAAIDEIVNVEGFTAATEANIVDDMVECRKATNERDWAKVVSCVHSIATKARRVSDVARNRTAGMSDAEQRIEIRGAIKSLEIGVATMLKLSKKLVEETPVSEETLTEFIKSLENVLNLMHSLQSVIPETMEEPAPPTSIPVVIIEHSTPVNQRQTSSDKTTPTESAPPPLPMSEIPTAAPVSSDGYYTSPSDGWINMGSFAETTPSSFDPTLPSDGPPFSSHQRPDRRGKDYFETQPMLYPSSLGGFSPHPSLLGAQSWPSEGSVNDTKSKETGDTALLEMYSQPLRSVITAATRQNPRELHAHATALSEKSQQLVKMAETVASNTKDTELARILDKESAKLNYLTPRIIKKAEELAQGEEPDGREELELLTQQWAGHVRNLIEASHDVNMPWSRSARRLVTSAKTRRGLNKEISHISTQTERMVDVATTTIKAAAIEDAIGSMGNLEHEPDPIIQDQIEEVKGHIEDIQMIVPNFISTAQRVSTQLDHEEQEKLSLLSHKWATKANVLLSGVDNITIGMSGPADSLLIAANSKDIALLEDQSKSIIGLAKSMMLVSQDALQGCTDEEKIETVTETAETLQNLSSELVECAKEIATTLDRSGEDYHPTVEKAEILRRDWGAKMHLLTAHIDDLTATVAGPLDRLVSVALQASRTDGLAKDHLMEQFEKKERFIDNQMEVVASKLDKVVCKLETKDDSIQSCLRGLSFLQKVTPHAVGAARSLSSDPGSAKLDHFSHLRRQWASKAQFFYANLVSAGQNLEATEVINAFEDLLQGYTRTTPTSFKIKSKPSEKTKEDPLKQKCYSTEDIDQPPNWPAPPIPSDEDELGPSKDSPPRHHQLKKTPRSPQIHTKVKPRLEAAVAETSLNNSIVVAARSLHDAADEFMEEGNPLVSLAKRMSEQMLKMAEYSRGSLIEETMPRMIQTARAIAKNAQEIHRYATLISERCADKRMKTNLQYCAEMIPTLSTQLSIIATVKESTPDISADILLVKNAQNLMTAVIQTIQAAEAAYVKGLKPPENDEEDKTVKLAIEWKRKHYYQRTVETITAPMGAKGLRKLSKQRHSALDILPYQKSITGQKP